ncbi:MAG: nitroreductase family deazaflavin-dependent oxidoreductase [Acidimicrobiia bacterium]
MSSTNEPGYTKPDISLMGAEHVRVYQETNGEVGYMWNGAPILLLTTIGRKSGQPRTIPIIFGTDGEDILLIGSVGGAPKHPDWYFNIQANPRVRIQIKDKVFEATARDATAEEKPRLWKLMTDIWPNYDVYTTRTTRVIPLVIVTPDAS